jgi:TRAP transporter 4TM/12TM fusion protein
MGEIRASTQRSGGLTRAAGMLFAIGVRRRPRGWLARVITPYAAAVGVWVIYSATYAVIHPWVLAAMFLCAVFGLLFLLVGASPNSDTRRPAWFDWVWSIGGIASGAYFAINASVIIERIPELDPLTGWDIFFGYALLLLTLEATRRTTGLGLTIIVLIFVAYNFLGHLLGGVLNHAYIDAEYFIDMTVYTTYGINGLPVRVAATYAFMFVLFGTLLNRTGGGEFFFNIAAALTGKRAGGPAKIAVVSSGLYGMISGSSVSDVVTTGSITIPMMRRLGYSGELAGAIEVSASTGGSLLPPVMGAAAFVMVEYTGISYREIATAALVPALLYYLSVYAQVHLRSLKMGLKGLARDEIPSFGKTMRAGWRFILPLLALIIALLIGFSPTFVALFGTLAVLVAGVLRIRGRIGFRDLYEGLAETVSRMLAVTGACAAAGLVIGGLTLTGLAQKVAQIVYALTDAQLFPSLLLAAAVTIVLGLGMPTVSAYILAAVLVGPLLADLGVPILAAHMFLLYYAVMSAITPPVAVAAYAAAAIAEDNPLRIAVTAVRLSLAAFVVPFAFVYGNELLLVGEPLDVAFAIVSASVGVILLAVAMEGYFRRPLQWWARVLVAVSAILFVVPGYAAALLGAAFAGAALGGEHLVRRIRVASSARAADGGGPSGDR